MTTLAGAAPVVMLDRARVIARRGVIVSVVALVGIAVAVALALGFTPVEARQGLAQKIFYLHVPSAWCTLLAFSLVGLEIGRAHV